MGIYARDTPRDMVPFMSSEERMHVNESKRKSEALFCNLGKKNWLVLEVEKNLDLSLGSQYARWDSLKTLGSAEAIQREQGTVAGI